MLTLLRKNSNLKKINEINIVPYVDVMLVLLVIFMVTAPTLQQAIQVDLPQSAGKPIEQAKKSPMIVTLSKSGNIYLSSVTEPNRSVLLDDLNAEIKAILKLEPTRMVIVKADKGVVYDNVISLMSALQQAGASNIGLETKFYESK